MTITINSADELAPLIDVVKQSADTTRAKLATAAIQGNGIELFMRLRFESFGRDPLDPDRPLNFVEQLNQTTSHLAALHATRYLFENHATSAPFTLTLGPQSGPDIISNDHSVVAEVFAAVSPDSNDKLRDDVKKAGLSSAKHKYVFYFCPGHPKRVAQVDGVKTISLGSL